MNKIPKSLNVIFMGTPAFALPALKQIHTSQHNLLSVFTKEPKNSGRGNKLQKSPIHIATEKLSIPILTPKNLRIPNIEHTIEQMHPDVIVVAAYGHILPQNILSIPKYGCINIHPSLLPRWRGASPIESTILSGDTKTGVCIIQMDEGLDTGDILMQKALDVDSHWNSSTLADITSQIGAEMLVNVLDNIDDLPPPIKQSDITEINTTYAHKIKKEDSIVNWNLSAYEIDRKVKAFDAWPGCFFKFNNELIRIVESELYNYTPTPSHSDSNSIKPPGTLLDKHCTISCQNGVIRLLKIQRPGKKNISAKDMLNGLRLKTGDRLI